MKIASLSSLPCQGQEKETKVNKLFYRGYSNSSLAISSSEQAKDHEKKEQNNSSLWRNFLINNKQNAFFRIHSLLGMNLWGFTRSLMCWDNTTCLMKKKRTKQLWADTSFVEIKPVPALIKKSSCSNCCALRLSLMLVVLLSTTQQLPFYRSPETAKECESTFFKFFKLKCECNANAWKFQSCIKAFYVA